MEKKTHSIAKNHRLPPWFRVKIRRGERYACIESLIKEKKLNTVCKDANCPNIWECWNMGAATFMILGDICTRNCRFCGVSKGTPLYRDEEEAIRVAEAVCSLKLDYAVITSVTRDDLDDGGASVFASVIGEIKTLSPMCGVEVLVPDFRGKSEAIIKIVEARPDVIGHNIETVKRLYPEVRQMADYRSSLDILRIVKEFDRRQQTKSSLIIGMGEEFDEVVETMEDIAKTGCDVLTIGQYLRPSKHHIEVKRFYTPDEFNKFKQIGNKLGFSHTQAGPIVRSSYHAGRYSTPQKQI